MKSYLYSLQIFKNGFLNGHILKRYVEFKLDIPSKKWVFIVINSILNLYNPQPLGLYAPEWRPNIYVEWHSPTWVIMCEELSVWYRVRSYINMVRHYINILHYLPDGARQHTQYQRLTVAQCTPPPSG